MRQFRSLSQLIVFALATCVASPAAQSARPAETGLDARLSEALRWLEKSPRFQAEYNFELTVEIRLLVFWTAKDDMGGGYIKLGEAADDPSLEVIRLLFGSDPAKAHGINRWGAATEVAKREPGGAVKSSAFFGFMKSSQGESASGMQREISNEKEQGRHRFEAVISRVDPGSAVSATVPFYSDRDFVFSELEPAELTVLQEVQGGHDRKVHTLEGAPGICARGNGFLSTVQKLANEALDKTQSPAPLCYIYNSKEYVLTLDGARPVPAKTIQYTLADTRQKVQHSYRDLEETRFHVLNQATGKKTYFAVLFGTTGSLRGAPVQIDYQPNWWFRIVLSLKPAPDVPAKSGCH